MCVIGIQVTVHSRTRSRRRARGAACGMAPTAVAAGRDVSVFTVSDML